MWATVLAFSLYVRNIKELRRGIKMCLCVWAYFQCVWVGVCVWRCVRVAAGFPYVVHAWLVYCDTAEPRAGLNIWIFNAGSMISQTGPLII